MEKELIVDEIKKLIKSATVVSWNAAEKAAYKVYEYLQQQSKKEAIAFAEWAASENWQSYDSHETWINLQEGNKVLNTENLYKLFNLTNLKNENRG